MNTYKNTRTGTILHTASTVTGENWEPVKKSKPPKDKKKPEGGEDKANAGEGLAE